MYQIIFSANNNAEVMVLPYVPPDFQIPSPQNNGTYNGLSRDYNMIGTMGLRQLELEAFFPVGRRYPFMPAAALTDGWQYVSFFERWRAKKVPIRVVLLDGSNVSRLNMACTIDAFSHGVRRNGDISYSLTAREYRFIGG